VGAEAAADLVCSNFDCAYGASAPIFLSHHSHFTLFNKEQVCVAQLHLNAHYFLLVFDWLIADVDKIKRAVLTLYQFV